MEFKYKAKTKDGESIEGTLETQDEVSASASIREKGLYVMELKTVSEGAKSVAGRFSRKKVPIKEKIIFTEQLAVMIKAGLSIVEALEALKDETQNKYFAAQIQKIITEVKGGTPISKALSEHRDIFSDIYINMIKSGEESGKVDIVLERLATQLEKDYDLNRKIKGALAYPIFVLVTLVVVIILMFVFVIPQLTSIFTDSGIPLPTLTKAIMGISTLLRKHGLIILGAGIIIFLVLARYKKTPTGRRFFDAFLLKLPVFGILLRKTYMARFTRTFSSLVASGLPLLDVFRVTGKTIGNVLYEEELEKMALEVKAGQPISKTLKKSVLFPKMIGQLATVGEKSGSIDKVFDKLADFFDRDVDTMTGNLSTLLEPILMLVMGVGVGLVIISVLQPLYGMVNAI